MSHTERQFFTPPQIATMTGIKLDSILTWIHEGTLKAYNTAADPNGHRPRWRIYKADLDAFLETRANAMAPPPVPRRGRRKQTGACDRPLAVSPETSPEV